MRSSQTILIQLLGPYYGHTDHFCVFIVPTYKQPCSDLCFVWTIWLLDRFGSGKALCRRWHHRLKSDLSAQVDHLVEQCTIYQGWGLSAVAQVQKNLVPSAAYRPLSIASLSWLAASINTKKRQKYNIIKRVSGSSSSGFIAESRLMYSSVKFSVLQREMKFLLTLFIQLLYHLNCRLN